MVEKIPGDQLSWNWLEMERLTLIRRASLWPSLIVHSSVGLTSNKGENSSSKFELPILHLHISYHVSL